MQNIKVDIVYYMSNTDFEMEFNLCGCCRMRLLTNKADDKKELISALSKAVDRSRVILVCGAMFGEEGLTKTISTALGAQMHTLNNAECGIDSEGEINIIEGATPLVTPDGVFGGFIIESGPQSIIILTDNKGIRKKLMNNLVHKYIEELSLIPVESATNPQPAIDTKENETVAQETEDGENVETAPEEETVADNNEDIKEQSEQIFEEKVEENSVAEENSENIEEGIKDEPKAGETSKEEHNISFVDKNGATLENEEAQLYINPQKAKRKKNSYYEYYVPSKDNELFVAGVQDDDTTRKPSKPRSLNIPIIIILCLLLIIVFVAAYFLIGIPLLSGKDITSYVSNIFAESSSAI